jgi:predicted lysophospholipase L1 biosynthesis ABC-type transport system permease subunit
MDTTTRRSPRPLLAAVLAALALALLATGPSAALAGELDTGDTTLVMAVGEHERRPIAPTQRDQLGLVLYGFMAIVTVVGIATLRRQLKGERPQTDGEFR